MRFLGGAVCLLVLEEGRKGRGGEGAGACDGRTVGEAAGLILFFPLLTLPTQVLLARLLACLHTLLTLGGGSSRNLELCGVQKKLISFSSH